jgi:medium-chain acyl-[acyl-carrier-protein] hydrolase
MEQLADDIGAFTSALKLPSYTLFGHSFGGMVCFELAHRLREEFGVGPDHLFVSGCRAPHLPRVKAQIHHLPDEQFVSKLKDLNGTPPEVLNNPELMQVMMATLRADFKLAETYSCAALRPLGCSITVMGGTEDGSVMQDDLAAWRFQTTAAFDLWMLPGDHFFLHSSESMVLQILTHEFKRILG